ncbi:LANO_0A04830g1_1 [Lachancea nothofagi CBS 11611]|uniref:LANO_0A04830g1_1 n=1 Tax=Lachancea nothofagi CBS 11611 TaxID=1266666 RepID=A0A1G4IQH8_9SACH|nr:LANO_0A04830g1_1 [Lachancea nothofagi CBS 11611]
MVVLNPNNWHWVEKNTLPWTEEYMQLLCTSVDVTGQSGPHKVVIEKLESVSGDSHVSQRKGKVICYFDLNLKFAAQVLENESGNLICEGKIVVPELLHDESDFEIRPEGFGDHYALVNKQLVPSLRTALCEYQTALIAQHSKDVQQEQMDE